MRFFDSTIAILATQILGLISVFFVNLLISRHFGEAGKGYVSLIVYLAEVLFSISNLALGFTAQYYVSKGLAAPRRLYSNIVLFSISAGIVVVALFVLTHSWWRGFLQNLDLSQLLPSLILVFALLIFEPACQLLIAIGRIGKRSAVILSQNYLLLGALIVLLVVTIPHPQHVAWLYVATCFAAVLVAILVLKQDIGLPTSPSFSLFKATMKYGGWIYAANLFGYLYARTDFFVLSALGSIEAAGVYSVASGLTSPLFMLAMAVHTVFYPKTSSESDDDAAVTTPFYYRQALLVQSACALGLAVLARPVLGWYGPGFVSGLVPMLILLLAVIGRGLNGILILHILGRGKAYTKSLAVIGALVVAIVLCYLLIPRYGMTGAATATAVAVFTENIILTFLYRKLVHGRISDLYRFEKRDFTVSFKEGMSLLKRLRSKS